MSPVPFQHMGSSLIVDLILSDRCGLRKPATIIATKYKSWQKKKRKEKSN